MRQTSSALSKTVELFRWVANETAADLGYRYPDTDDERVTAWIAAHSEKPDCLLGPYRPLCYYTHGRLLVCPGWRSSLAPINIGMII